MERVTEKTLDNLFTDRNIDWNYSFWKEPERDFNGRHLPEKYYVEFETSSPAGEDFLMDIDYDPENPVESLIENMEDYYQDFDPEEHAEMWIELRGKRGVPDSIRTLVDDADAIDGMIKDLIFALKGKVNASKRTITKDELTKIVGARDVLCSYCESDGCEKCIVTMLVDNACNESTDKGDIL